jgi:imidazolonepropionase-like amidohydrolase
MVEYGAKPIDAIRTATINAADLLNLSGKAGVIKPGSFADLIAVDSDPRANVEVLQHVRFVLKDGKIFRDDWEPGLSVRGR